MFWRTEFAKGGMPEDKFKKEHMYNIRHSYGKEGKRVNYTPASCMSVIGSNPGEVSLPHSQLQSESVYTDANDTPQLSKICVCFLDCLYLTRCDVVMHLSSLQKTRKSSCCYAPRDGIKLLCCEHT